MPAADHDHHIGARGDLPAFALAFPRRRTDSAPNLRPAHAPPDHRAERLEALRLHRGLRYDQRLVYFRQCQRLSLGHHGVAHAIRPAQNTLNLRMRALAHHNDRPARPRRLTRHFMNARHKGTGGIQHLTAARRKRLDRFAPHAMGADHHAVSGRNGLGRVYAHHAARFKRGYHLRIVNNRPQRISGCSGRCRIHRPPHAKAKSGVPGHDNLSDKAPPPA